MDFSPVYLFLRNFVTVFRPTDIVTPLFARVVKAPAPKYEYLPRLLRSYVPPKSIMSAFTITTHFALCTERDLQYIIPYPLYLVL